MASNTKSVVYWITFENGLEYIGKLSSDRVLWAHLMKWYPNTNSTAQQSTWETEWKKNVKEYGLVKQTFVKGYKILDTNAAKTALIASGFDSNAYKQLQNIWGLADKELIEMILIILSKYSGNNIGQVMDRGRQDSSSNVDIYISPEAIKQIATRRIESLNEFWFNFKNNANVQNIDELITSGIEDVVKSKTGATRITKKLGKILAVHITEHTVQHLSAQLKSKANKTPMLKGLVNATIKELKETTRQGISNINYNDLFNIIYDSVQKRKGLIEKRIDKNEWSPIAISKMIYDWLHSGVTLDNIFGAQGLITIQIEHSCLASAKRRRYNQISGFLNNIKANNTTTLINKWENRENLYQNLASYLSSDMYKAIGYKDTMMRQMITVWSKEITSANMIWSDELSGYVREGYENYNDWNNYINETSEAPIAVRHIYKELNYEDVRDLSGIEVF